MNTIRWLSGIVMVLGIMTSTFAAGGGTASCPAISISQCRADEPEGGLVHKPNSKGHVIWTSRCEPNSIKSHLDALCNEISSCSAAGGFGLFLRAVTNDCRAKSYGNVFGLDGLTFGILDWTEDNLPSLLGAYKARDQAGFAQHFGALNLPVQGDCVDKTWVCQQNRQGGLMCDGTRRGPFSIALEAALKTAEFRKVQTERALAAYESRLPQADALGLSTDFGRIAITVVKNNLKSGDACKPATWKAQCADKPNERELVICMLDRYVDGECRGSRKQSESRRNAILAAFKAGEQGVVLHPEKGKILACSTSWDQ